MTVLYVVLSVFPIIKVESVAVFAVKISLVIVIANLVGHGHSRIGAQATSGEQRSRLTRTLLPLARWWHHSVDPQVRHEVAVVLRIVRGVVQEHIEATLLLAEQLHLPVDASSHW